MIEYAGSILAVIERAARDPNTDIDKLERLFALKERMDAQAAKQEFTQGKIAMRSELPEITMKGCIRIVKDGKVIQETPFARFEDIHDAVIPVLTRHGFDLAFKNGLSPEGKVRVTTVLSHVGGHEEETYFDLPHDSSGSKNSVQAVGSSTSYGKRYGTLSILNIKVSGEDDDGQQASYKDSKGEPLARTKLDGPHSSKSALKAAVQAMRFEVQKCTDTASIDKLLKDNKDTIDQANRDWSALIEGNPDLPEDRGLKGDVAQRRDALRGEADVKAVVASMKQCDSTARLYRWRDTNEGLIETLDGANGRLFEQQWEAHESSLLAKEAK